MVMVEYLIKLKHNILKEFQDDRNDDQDMRINILRLKSMEDEQQVNQQDEENDDVMQLVDDPLNSIYWRRTKIEKVRIIERKERIKKWTCKIGNNSSKEGINSLKCKIETVSNSFKLFKITEIESNLKWGIVCFKRKKISEEHSFCFSIVKEL